MKERRKVLWVARGRAEARLKDMYRADYIRLRDEALVEMGQPPIGEFHIAAPKKEPGQVAASTISQPLTEA